MNDFVVETPAPWLPEEANPEDQLVARDEAEELIQELRGILGPLELSTVIMRHDIDGSLGEMTFKDIGNVLGGKSEYEIRRTYETGMLRLANHLQKQGVVMPRDESRSDEEIVADYFARLLPKKNGKGAR